jgi:hypothetical protein
MTDTQVTVNNQIVIGTLMVSQPVVSRTAVAISP